MRGSSTTWSGSTGTPTAMALSPSAGPRGVPTRRTVFGPQPLHPSPFGKDSLVTKLLVGFAFLGALALFAEGENVIQTDFPYANMTALTIVAVVLVFIVTKMLPDLHGKITQAIGAVAKQG